MHCDDFHHVVFVVQVAMQADLRAMDATLSEHDRNTPKLIIETKGIEMIKGQFLNIRDGSLTYIHDCKYFL